MTDHPAPARDEPAAQSNSPDLPKIGIGPHFEMHPVVFPAGAIIVISLVLLTTVFPADSVQSVFDSLRDWIGTRFGWLYVISMSAFLVFALWLGLGRYGSIKLGHDDDEPEFGRPTWFAMLFSAGMGIGLVFWSVAEPIYHFNAQPPGFAEGLDPTRVSMAVTIFHWGLHPWALYAVVGLALAYFGFRRDMPLGFRSILYPLFGDRMWGRWGDAVDTLTIIATLTGVATSLGLGAQQVNAGLAFLLGAPIDTGMQIALIASITAIATVSVVLGLGTGIRRLSELNMSLAALLMVIVILTSGIVAFLGATIENTGAYLQLLPFISLRTGASNPDGQTWLSSWTVFYWAWWISWSPFVGMFIARVSRGRTIREFIGGVLLVPTAVGIIWLTAFGATTLRQHTQHVHQAETADGAPQAEALPTYPVAQSDGKGNLITDDEGLYVAEEQPLTAVEYLSAPVVTDDHEARISQLPTVLFVLLESVMPNRVLVVITIGIATICIILFFVTSSDSASMVIDIIASGGNPDPPVGTRLFWAVSEGVVASVLLLAGGLGALQAASIAAALPFTVVLILACFALARALKHDPAILAETR